LVDVTSQVQANGNAATFLLRAKENCCCTTGWGTETLGSRTNARFHWQVQLAPPPQLALIPSAPYVILTWPTDYAGFSYAGYALQSSTNLGSSAVWSTNSSPPVVIGGQNVIINTLSGAQEFYRLMVIAGLGFSA